MFSPTEFIATLDAATIARALERGFSLVSMDYSWMTAVDYMSEETFRALEPKIRADSATMEQVKRHREYILGYLRDNSDYSKFWSNFVANLLRKPHLIALYRFSPSELAYLAFSTRCYDIFITSLDAGADYAAEMPNGKTLLDTVVSGTGTKYIDCDAEHLEEFEYRCKVVEYLVEMGLRPQQYKDTIVPVEVRYNGKLLTRTFETKAVERDIEANRMEAEMTREEKIALIKRLFESL